MTLVKRFAALVATLAVAFGTMLLASGPASAATYEKLNVSQACQLQYGGDTPQLVSAGNDNPNDKNGWYCQRKTSNTTSYGISGSRSGFEASAEVGSSTTILGGVNLQAWCDKYHPGTKVDNIDDLSPWKAYNWRCVRYA